ncbi:MAG: hypothetical protein ACMG57_03570 [Candidatus Dojkabacteria bacterium]
MTSGQILRFIIPVAIIYILGLVVPYTILSNANLSAGNTNLAIVQTYIDSLMVSQPASSPV